MSSENVFRLNQILDSGNYKASIRTKRDAVYIRGTFLCSNGKRVRKEIALNAKIYDFTTCRDRIRDFYLEYERKGYLPNEFSWNKTVEVKEFAKNTVEYGIEKFKEEYWESKGNPSEEEKTSESKRTLISYTDQLRKLEKYNNLELTPELLRTVIEEKSRPNTKPRQDMCKIFKRLGKLFFVESDLKEIDKIRGKYIPSKRKRIDEDSVVEDIDKIRDHPKYGWLTAAVFIYGCRPNEAFSIVPQENGIAKAVNCPKAEKKSVKFPIALGLEKDNYKPDLLIKRWNIFDVQRDFYFDLENDLYDSEGMKKKVEAWTKWLKKNTVSSFGLVDLRHYWGIRSIYADLDIRTSCKSLGHSQAIHTKTYNSTYEEIDAIKGAKRL